MSATYLNEEFGTLVGRTIKAIRPLTEDECHELWWEPTLSETPFALVFDDNSAAVVSCDPEGNGPGWLILADVVPK